METYNLPEEGAGEEKAVMAARKKEYVTKYLPHPSELREFSDGEEVKR